MKTELTYNGKSVKSKAFTKSAQLKGSHSNSMLINNHLIHGTSKEDCISYFEANRSKYESLKNTVEYFFN